MAEVFFLRSPVAHGKIRSITVPEAARGQVFFASDIAFTKPIVAVSAAKGFKPSNYPALTSDKARFVGDLLAMCIAPTRAEAEDIAQSCVIDFEELPAIWDIDIALKPDAPRVHDHWSDNVYIESRIATGDLDQVRAVADVRVRKSLRMGRHAGVSMEGRGVLAHYDRRLDELVVHSSTQFPHVIRTILAESLGISESKLRVVAPDVGGGFGPKNNFNPEELAIAALSMKLNRPLRWIEDRREHLIASPHAREHRYELTAYADNAGRILGLEAEVVVDAGAYSVWPWTASMEAGMSAGIMTGPYDIPVYHARAVSVATNKSPLGPYRGVGRSGACFAIETVVDAVARAVGREPADVRILNMVPPEAMPYKSATHKFYDSGNYPECARRACDAIGLSAVRGRQSKPEPDGRLIGFGMASYTEQSAHGTAEWVARGLPVVFGYEPALPALRPTASYPVRRDPESRAGAGDDARPGREPGTRNSRQGRHRQAWRQFGIALRNGDVCLAQHDDVGRGGVGRLRHPGGEDCAHRRAICCRHRRISSVLPRGGSISASRAFPSRKLARPLICIRSVCRSAKSRRWRRVRSISPVAAPALSRTRRMRACSRSIRARGMSRCLTTWSATTAGPW